MDDSKFKALEGLAIASFVEGIRIGAKIGIESQLEGLNGQDTITLFNKKIFDSGVSFASLVDPADSYFGRVTSELFDGKHYRTKLVSTYHYISQSIKHLEKLDPSHFEQ